MCTDSDQFSFFLLFHCIANITIYTDGTTDCLTLWIHNDPLCIYVCMCLHSMKCVSPFLSSQPAAGVGSVHAEANGPVSNAGEGSDGVAGEETL